MSGIRRISALSLLLLVGMSRAETVAADGPEPPNVVIFLTDDLGYGDLGCYGAPRIRTPHLDRMAAEGTRLTDFHVQPVCGVSRASLMTGCYPIRVAEVGNTKSGHPVLHTDEVTMAEVLRARGYRTALVGKWHLAGGRKEAYDESIMPTGQGFDEFFGTPLHNGFTREVEADSFKTQIMRGMEILDDFLDPEEMGQLTQRYTEEAVRFIRENRDRPFFLYLAHNMPHVPLGVSKEFRGRSAGGTYGDTIEELDASMGRVLDTLESAGIDEKTLVIFTSDNGPWVEDHLVAPDGSDPYYGSAGPLRGAKMMTWEGGLRVPCIVRWPGRVPSGRVCDELLSSMDLLPTLARLAGASLPEDRTLDGHDVWPILSGEPGAKNPRTTLYYYCYNHLQAVRRGRWKLVRPRPEKPRWCSWSARMVDAVAETELYDLRADVGETTDVASHHPEIVLDLTALAEKAREELGDYDRIGTGARFFDDGPRRPDAARWSGVASTGDRPRHRPGPYDEAPPVGPLRFDFETGDLQGWRVVEGEFDRVVSDRRSLPRWTDVPLNKQGRFHLSTVETEESASDAMTGVIESPRFLVEGARISFLVGGGHDDRTYVALCADDGTELLRTGGPRGPFFRRVEWDVSEWKGQDVFVRVVDRKESDWGHITLDDFSAKSPRLSRRVQAFYYPWYGNPETDGRYANWNHPVAVRSGPPRQFPGGDDIGANFYPSLGCYSSNSAETLEQHMKWLRRARVGVICVSWWGRGSFTDRALAPLFRSAERHGIRITFHIEPHIGPGGRNAETTRDAIRHLLDRFGRSPALYRDPYRGRRPMVFVYDSYLTKAEEWASLLEPGGERTIRGTPYDVIAIGLWVKEREEKYMARSGFDGFYTYFATEGFTYGSTPAHWGRLARWAREHGKIFVPCVGPGYIDERIRPWNGRNTRSRRGGKYYDEMFRAAIDVAPPAIGITSFNEWHEGTQIEPAAPKRVGEHRYEDYSPLPPEDYLDRTARWVEEFESARRPADGR